LNNKTEFSAHSFSGLLKVRLQIFHSKVSVERAWAISKMGIRQVAEYLIIDTTSKTENMPILHPGSFTSADQDSFSY